MSIEVEEQKTEKSATTRKLQRIQNPQPPKRSEEELGTPSVSPSPLNTKYGEDARYLIKLKQTQVTTSVQFSAGIQVLLGEDKGKRFMKDLNHELEERRKKLGKNREEDMKLLEDIAGRYNLTPTQRSYLYALLDSYYNTRDTVASNFALNGTFYNESEVQVIYGDQLRRSLLQRGFSEEEVDKFIKKAKKLSENDESVGNYPLLFSIEYFFYRAKDQIRDNQQLNDGEKRERIKNLTDLAAEAFNDGLVSSEFMSAFAQQLYYDGYRDLAVEMLQRAGLVMEAAALLLQVLNSLSKELSNNVYDEEERKKIEEKIKDACDKINGACNFEGLIEEIEKRKKEGGPEEQKKLEKELEEILTKNEELKNSIIAQQNKEYEKYINQELEELYNKIKKGLIIAKTPFKEKGSSNQKKYA